MAALLVLSGDQDRIEAWTKLLQSIDKSAVIGVINNCVDLGVSESTLAKIASLALDNRAAQTSSLILSRQTRNTIQTGQLEIVGLKRVEAVTDKPI